MWILAIGLLAVFAGLGYAKGSIRMAVSLAGLIVGVMVAVPLGHALRPVMKPLGVVNPVWLTVVPPVVAFALVYLIVMGLSFFVHHKIYLRYKYKHD
ncbi:MAG TPA: CvpA family protein, partial [Verrucomicrobiae bacterium]|nr:CvpA family protein [Verrucomicrobiae bacterium]